MFTLKFLAFVGAVQGLPWDGVKPTGVFDQPFGLHQQPPKPTQAAVDLRKRQAAGDVTCGYEDGISSAALYCLSAAVCATNSLGGMGCCYSTGLDNCLLPTACIDSTALRNYDSSYLANPYVTWCTDATAPLCITEYLKYDVVATGFDCGNTLSVLTQSFYTTATNTSVPSISVFNAFYSATTPHTTSASSIHSSSMPTTSPSPTPSPTPNPSPNSTPTPTPTPAPASSSAPIGAIVGGAVGGVAVIAIVGFIVFFLLRRNKRKNNNDPQPPYPGVAPMQQTQEPPPVHPQQMYPQQPQYQYPGPGPANAQSPPQVYPAGYQNAYPEKIPPQENTYPVYGSPQTGHSEPMSAGAERLSSVPPYSPQPNSAGGYDSKNDMNIHAQPTEVYHELSEQNR